MDDNKRKCYDCKHYVKTLKNKMFNFTVYGCELWNCRYSQKEEPEDEKRGSGESQG